VRRETIGLGVHRDGLKTFFVARPDNANRNLTPVRNEDSTDRRHRSSVIGHQDSTDDR